VCICASYCATGYYVLWLLLTFIPCELQNITTVQLVATHMGSLLIVFKDGCDVSISNENDNL